MYKEPGKFDTMMGVVLSSIDVKYPTKLGETRRCLLKMMEMVYCYMKDAIQAYDPTHKDIRENKALGQLRESRKRWMLRIRKL